MTDGEFYRAYSEEERQARIANSKLGAILAIILVPLGTLLDYFVYADEGLLIPFLKLRLLCSVIVGIVLALFYTQIGLRFYRILGMAWYLIPALFITLMIYKSGDPASPYYAGLNIVLLGVGLILPWTYRENLVAAVLIMLMYIVTFVAITGSPAEAPATAAQTPADAAQAASSTRGGSDDESQIGLLFNNLYFLALTGLIVVVGSYSHNRMRFREFALRYQLEENRKVVEENNRKLRELDQVKNRFFANVSHELRTPLTLLLTPLESLMREQGEHFSVETQQLLQTMHTNGMRLLKLINDLLDLVRTDSGTMQVNRGTVDVKSFVNGIVSSIQKTAEDKQVTLRTSLDLKTPHIMTDRDKLEKILLNLLFNALKFTPAGGRVEVRAENRDDCILFHVIDTGMGISTEQLKHVFDRFWQADTSAQRKYQGAGIGLALVKELAEAQGGEVIAESVVGEGTRFTVRLPCEAAQPDDSQGDEEEKGLGVETTPAQSNGKPDEWLTSLYRRAELFPAMSPIRESVRPVSTGRRDNRPRILVADDEPDMLRFLRNQLTKDYSVIEATDGLDATEKARQFLPEVILLDMMMPEKDGLQVCRELRDHTPTQGIPIVLLTARADDQTKLSGLDAGANDFLSKPFSITELHLRLRNLVSAHRLEQELARQNQRLEATLEELKETETQLVQTEKLASLGRLSAGIIHEINNPLNYAKTGLHTLRTFNKELPETEREEFDEIVTDIDEGIDRVKTIVSDLRAFTHPDEQNYDEVEVKSIVETALRFLSHEWRDNVRIEQSIPDGERIWANATSVTQVVTNILQNSLDALKDKSYPEGEQPTISIRLRHEGDRLILAIRDNGNGIPQEILNNIFDPFFTSKDVGEGMGLGLSICYRIMENHGGAIRVDTEAGAFAEFNLEFPARGALAADDAVSRVGTGPSVADEARPG